jgi:hypothetical protein
VLIRRLSNKNSHHYVMPRIFFALKMPIFLSFDKIDHPDTPDDGLIIFNQINILKQ